MTFEDLFWTDSVRKNMVITFADGDVINNSDLESEQFTLIEALCTQPNLAFGDCNASEVQFPFHNVIRPKTGVKFNVDIKFPDYHNSDIYGPDAPNPTAIATYRLLTGFKTNRDIPTADRTKREITAYDAIYDMINADVASWYNGLWTSTTTHTLQEVFVSFLGHFNVTYVTPITNPNMTMTVKKTIQPTTLSGREVLKCMCEVMGGFPHIHRDGKFEAVMLEAGIQGLYPSETLFPSDDLYPKAGSGTLVTRGRYIPPLKYEDYDVETITGIRIRTQEGEVGTTVGTTTNVYEITNNFLLYGKSASELTSIATNLLNKIKGLVYKPFSVKAKGNPELKVGSAVRMNTSTARVESYILERRLTGIQAMIDTLSAEGEQKQSVALNSITSQFQQLAGKTLKIQADTDGIRTDVADLATQTASSISQLSGEINLKVSHGQIMNGIASETAYSAIQITPSTIAVSSSGTFTVDSTNFKLNSSGTATMNGATITGGSITMFGTYGETMTLANGKISISNYSGSSNAQFALDSIAIASGSNQIQLSLSGGLSVQTNGGTTTIGGTVGYINGAQILTEGSYISNLNLHNGGTTGAYVSRTPYWRKVSNLSDDEYVICGA